MKPKYLVLLDSELHGVDIKLFESTDFFYSEFEADSEATHAVAEGERKAYVFKLISVYEPNDTQHVDVVLVDRNP